MCFSFWPQSEKPNLTKHQKLSKWSTFFYLHERAALIRNISVLSFSSQGPTRGRWCLPEARWSREATATAAFTTRPAAVCLCTEATRRSTTTSTVWWTTCTATTSTRGHGERHRTRLHTVSQLHFVKKPINPFCAPFVLSEAAGNWSQSHHAPGHRQDALCSPVCHMAHTHLVR